jgi:hypothetical protein
VRIAASSLILSLLVSAAVSPARADVELQTKTRENLGIQVEPVQVTDSVRVWPGVASVLDISGLVTAINEVQAAEAAAAASRGEARRTTDLYRNDKNASRKALDTALAQSIADNSRVATARGQLLGTWGSSIASMPSPARQRLIENLLAGRSSLVRAELLLPIPSTAKFAQATLTDLNGAGSWPATSLGRLPQSAGATSSASVLLRVEAALPAGQLLQAALTESQSQIRGPTVPIASIIRWHGTEWVYEETEPNHFIRRAVRLGARANGRAFLDGEIAAGAKVVIVGARALLAAELTPASASNEGG